ncbi:Transcriptional regulator, TetR family OS=Tsukamurella paurometabola (strain ATCC 8368 / DSM/ CCUG 35730 / CIP 100753 / JCM 10117 / KCTC 9821 / NBRC 16120/ NCIMB 702349 / NCTC 13040) OX=521096 GN=Tpau_3322 PE=4 SV=1 [Tsukamurella paurometabola]|uniref:Transcriptional regulator, TetR family n=1 Tax=Tsukamurella paurometabola (strain ATCC 8368 / DSM 20162 / CCUG 35730 / CIP 100753 / JCM 10117 / KCTC 9821 / NBRC 16120 / NCIMB 702349 / NCTC 13040) TaxID=521096 RepID=D5UWA8_TSUPD|nr:TetR/AcrR family transcriptional regulator [Tsukamurella paurometabola]ADG79907.1 transcriptional regulator, TetR family [Tsukamurella paurometabola DSM 20162]SUP37610.1 HTH-type transcriptional regulator EthR [Tsukamurella paurometabola]
MEVGTAGASGARDAETGTARERAKAARRRELLAAAARLMAERGFAGVRLEDIGSAAGVSGPAMYRHFAGKQDVLAALLVEISEYLYDGGKRVAAEHADDPRRALRDLVDFHVDFATSEPDLIRVQYRDLWSLVPESARRVRRLQRQYVELWTDQVNRLGGDPVENRARVHAVFGLLNSAPSLPALPAARLRAVLREPALAALGIAD